MGKSGGPQWQSPLTPEPSLRSKSSRQPMRWKHLQLSAGAGRRRSSTLGITRAAGVPDRITTTGFQNSFTPPPTFQNMYSSGVSQRSSTDKLIGSRQASILRHG